MPVGPCAVSGLFELFFINYQIIITEAEKMMHRFVCSSQPMWLLWFHTGHLHALNGQPELSSHFCNPRFELRILTLHFDRLELLAVFQFERHIRSCLPHLHAR